VANALSRLLRGGAAYQSPALVSGLLALVTLPLYTHELSPADLGVAETILTFIILGSIVLRGGLSEALIRLWFTEDDEAARVRLARTTLVAVAAVTTLVALVALPFAGPLADLLSGRHDAGIGRLAILGLWAFTNLETSYALLRVQERRRAFVRASMANVLLTVALTVVLVVVLDQGARGYLAGNYAASAVVLVGLWLTEGRRIGLRGGMHPLRPLLRFGLPIVPAEAAVFALNVVDRAYLLRTESAAAAGLFALAVKLATLVIVAVRAFGLAWPPLAYSVEDDEEARRLYAAVTTWYVVVIGTVVLGLALLARWIVDLLAAPEYFSAHEALGWVALGWGLYGLALLLVTVAGRARITTRSAPAAVGGLVANVVALLLLVPPLGIAGAGLALCVAYVVTLGILHLLTRTLFVVPFEWRRLTHATAVLALAAAAGELLLPDSGWGGLVARIALVAAVPAVLFVSGFLRPEERAALGRVAMRQLR
jgi:O-antigen/teichoic acid export membrane protein